MTGSQARDTFVRLVLSDSAYAIALGPTGVTHPRLRAALAQARDDWLSCTATESAYLLRFYKGAVTYFREVGDRDLERVCHDAYVAIAEARQRAGLPAVHRAPV